MEYDLKKNGRQPQKNRYDLKKKWKTTSKRQMENNLKKIKWKTT